MLRILDAESADGREFYPVVIL